jgi:hypothetical protein
MEAIAWLRAHPKTSSAHHSKQVQKGMHARGIKRRLVQMSQHSRVLCARWYLRYPLSYEHVLRSFDLFGGPFISLSEMLLPEIPGRRDFRNRQQDQHDGGEKPNRFGLRHLWR